jgi:hypothetical protein
VVVGALDVADPLAERFADGRQHRALQAWVHPFETDLRRPLETAPATVKFCRVDDRAFATTAQRV